MARARDEANVTTTYPFARTTARPGSTTAKRTLHAGTTGTRAFSGETVSFEQNFSYFLDQFVEFALRSQRL